MNLVLIHGSYFGSWCWERVTPELERLGHRVTAVDLPISERGHGASDYADAVIAGSDWADPRAHRPFHGRTRRTRRRRAARGSSDGLHRGVLAKPGVSAMDQPAAEPIDPTTPAATSEWTDLGDGLWSVGPDTAREIFMQDASDEVAAWALPRIRPQFYGVMTETTPLVAWPAVPSDYVVCRATGHPTRSGPACRDRSTRRLRDRVDGGRLANASTRPVELATLLDVLVRR